MITYRSSGASLLEQGAAEHSRYASNQPFAHVVVEDFFDAEVLEKVRQEALAVDPSTCYVKYGASNMQNRKYAFFPHVVGDETTRLINFLNSGPVLAWLEKLTGIPNLLADPSYFGAGLHRIESGGFLEVHADFNHLKRYNLERRINLLLYLNRPWQDEYNGKLELWDKQSAVVSAAPVFNRCVIFSTTADSLHGHPEPLVLPPGMARHSIALYYYTNTWDPTGQSTTTKYYLSPNSGAQVKFRRRVRDFILDFIPPVFRKGLRKVKRIARGETLEEL